MTSAQPRESEQNPALARRLPINACDALVLIAAVIAATCSYSTTSAPYNMAAIGFGAIGGVFALTKLSLTRPHTWSLVAAAVVSLVPQTLRPPSPNVHRTAFYPWSVALGVAAVLLLVLAIGVHRSWPAIRARWIIAAISAALAVTSIVLAIPGGAEPRIDVWDIFQQSSAGLFHGVNPYEITHFSVPAGQTASCFNYLPVSFLASWFGWVSLGDVRYAEVSVMLAGFGCLTAALVIRTQHRPRLAFKAVATMLTALTLAGTLRVAQQAWNESLILGFLLIGAALLLSRWRLWAWLPIALALATKQHLILILPLMAVWPCLGIRRTAYAVLGAVTVSAPWLIWNPSRFTTCTVKFFLDIQPRHDSISLWRFLPELLRTPMVLLAAAGALWLALRTVPRTVGGLLIASGVVLMGFDLFNKQSFENQWWLVGELLICGIAAQIVEADQGAVSRDAVAHDAVSHDAVTSH